MSFSGSKNSRERSLSPVSNADSSTDPYHGSLPDDQQKKIASADCFSHQQVEAHQDKEPGQDAHKKGPHHEAESSENGLGHETESGEKPHGKVEAASVGSLLVQQLQDMIANTIRAQYGRHSQDTFIYSKSYTKRLDNLRMPMSYQPPKFMQFDGKGNPKQHVAHFIEMCNSAGTNDDYLVKQFVRSLRGTTFNWYIDLEPESIDSWEQMEREFLNCFYSTCRSVSMLELTSTKQ
ncbi:hypothetical protein L3X38_005993 [Prunus dulcis]|uniref:Retrotransposon gag domain-containing protein n=1 Tax=Prunus dulcis TaxID=3755 RepID=A0AAD5F4L3_PRUDU|nr:hypothetical protein L3X38_005993 [Prunus dulcis]